MIMYKYFIKNKNKNKTIKQNTYKQWNWDTFFSYGRRIKECTNMEGITLFGDNAEGMKK